MENNTTPGFYEWAGGNDKLEALTRIFALIRSLFALIRV